MKTHAICSLIAPTLAFQNIQRHNFNRPTHTLTFRKEPDTIDKVTSDNIYLSLLSTSVQPTYPDRMVHRPDQIGAEVWAKMHDIPALPATHSQQPTTITKQPTQAQKEERQQRRRQRQQRQVAAFSSWKRRLNTREDKMGLHKLSCFAFTISNTVLLSAVALNGMQTVPEWLAPFDFVFVLSTVIMSLSSVDMSMSHRRAQPGSRDLFISLSFVEIATVFQSELFSSFDYSADLFSSKIMIDGLIGLPLLAFEGYMLKILLFNIPEILQSRSSTSRKGNSPTQKNTQQQRQQQHSGSKQTEKSTTAEASLFKKAVYVGAPFLFFILGGYYDALVLDPCHDKTWLINQAMETAQLPEVYFVQVLTVAINGYIALLVTLHDKHLISRSVETGLLTFLTAAMFGSLAHLMV